MFINFAKLFCPSKRSPLVLSHLEDSEFKKLVSKLAQGSIALSRNHSNGAPKIVNNKIVHMEMYRHATRAESAELGTEKTCRPATSNKYIWKGLGGCN